MLRLVSIVVLILGGLPGVGVGLTARGGECGDAACCAPPSRPACCDEPAVARDFCTMSGGPCSCGATPAPDQGPRPETPNPVSGRELLTLFAPEQVVRASILELDEERSVLRSLAEGGRSGLTHNEIQALLGVWRT